MLHNRKAKAGSADFLGMAFVHPIKTLENAFLIFFRNPDSRIPHIYTNHIAFILQLYKNLSTPVVIFDGIITDIVKNFFHNGRHRIQHGTSAFHIHMHFLLPGSFMKCGKNIMNHTVQIQFFPLIRQSAFIQTGDPDHISNQTDQPLRFLIDASCKNLHILILHKSVLHDLCKAGNRSQRCFQLVGNIGGKFSAQLFPFYFFGYVHQKNHRTFCLVFSCDRIGDHLDVAAIQTENFVLMISFKNLLHNTSEVLGTVQKIYAFPGSDLVYLKKLPDTGVSGKYHGITVDHKKTLLHVLRNNGEFFLLSSGRLKLQTDLTVLTVNFADKRFHLFIHINFFRMFQIQIVKRFHHPAGKSGSKYRRKNKNQKQYAQKRRYQLPHKRKS